MTVHASKGLEFPHVALADLRLSGKAESLVAENIAASTYVALDSPMLRPVRKTIQGLHEFIEQGDEPSADIMQASAYQDLMLSLKGYVATQELSEGRRLLYVALTRASKSLFIGVAHSGNKSFSYEGKGILDDLHEALQWEASATAPIQKLNYGGSAPMDFELTVLVTPCRTARTCRRREKTLYHSSGSLASCSLLSAVSRFLRRGVFVLVDWRCCPSGPRARRRNGVVLVRC